MKTLTAEQLQARMERGERFQMIDVRSPDEFASGHIPCAVNLPMDQVESRLDDLHHRDPVVLICQSGRRATLTRELLEPHLNDLLVLTAAPRPGRVRVFRSCAALRRAGRSSARSAWLPVC
jgi:rhodanese-related sulfurtransferase